MNDMRNGVTIHRMKNGIINKIMDRDLNRNLSTFLYGVLIFIISIAFCINNFVLRSEYEVIDNSYDEDQDPVEKDDLLAIVAVGLYLSS